MILFGSAIGIRLIFQFGSESIQPKNQRYEAGHYIGVLDGNMAYNEGRLKPTDEQLDAAARRASSNIKFNDDDDRQNWMNGYTSGFHSGWK
jgi:hypothetical protein